LHLNRDCHTSHFDHEEPDFSAVPVWAVVTSLTHTILNQKKAHTTQTDAKRQGTKINEKARETLTMKQWIEIDYEFVFYGFPP